MSFSLTHPGGQLMTCPALDGASTRKTHTNPGLGQARVTGAQFMPMQLGKTGSAGRTVITESSKLWLTIVPLQK